VNVWRLCFIQFSSAKCPGLWSKLESKSANFQSFEKQSPEVSHYQQQGPLNRLLLVPSIGYSVKRADVRMQDHRGKIVVVECACSGYSVKRADARACKISECIVRFLLLFCFEMPAKIKNSKRKANSPCENLSKSKPKTINPSIIMPKPKSVKPVELEERGMDESIQPVDNFCIRVVSKNGEEFFGALSQTQCHQLWMSLELNKINKDLLYGIALIQSDDRPFMVKFQLSDTIYLEEIIGEFTRNIDNDEYNLKVIAPREPPPRLGENFSITLKKTKFNITLDQVNEILARFGEITVKAVHINGEVDGIKTDDVLCVVKLRKHMPSFLPAYGIKLNVRYYGQPLQCSKCFNPGHLRKRCPNENAVEWSRYVNLLVEENVLKLEHLGNWVEKLQLSANANDSVNSDL